MAKKTFIRELVKIATWNTAATATASATSLMLSGALINIYSKPGYDDGQQMACLGSNDGVDYAWQILCNGSFGQ